MASKVRHSSCLHMFHFDGKHTTKTEINESGERFPFRSGLHFSQTGNSSEPCLTLIRISKWAFFVCVQSLNSVTEILPFLDVAKLYHTGMCGLCRKHFLFDSWTSTTLYFTNAKTAFYVLMIFPHLPLLRILLSTTDGVPSDLLIEFSWISYSNVLLGAKDTHS